MAKLNVPRQPIKTHEGGTAKRINPELALRRSVMACMLWEKTFYEDGQDVASRIANLVPQVEPEQVWGIAIEAREKMKLRHVPLLIAREMARHKNHKALVGATLARIIQRPDELTEFLAIYWKEKKQPLSGQVKKGLAMAFRKFNAYQLAKYNRDGAIKLRDVLFLSHAKPMDFHQDDVWKSLIDGTLATPDTWEVALSSGANKRATWERLIAEKKLGALALLRNIRNMFAADVTHQTIVGAIDRMQTDRVLPFRFISAARFAPSLEPNLETKMFECLNDHERLTGHTVLLIDVSGSMDEKISAKSDITRLDAACGVAMLAREICDQVDIFTFSEKLVQVPARRGFALRDAIVNSQGHSGTPLGLAVQAIYAPKDTKFKEQIGWMSSRIASGYTGQNLRPDRLIVITDEQSSNKVQDPIGKGYMINVGTYQNGVGYGPWTHIDGWSEAVIDYLQAFEHLEK